MESENRPVYEHANEPAARGRFAWRAFLAVAGILMLSLVGLAAYELGRLHEMNDEVASQRPASADELESAGGTIEGEAARPGEDARLPILERPQGASPATAPATTPAVVLAAPAPQSKPGDTTECARYQAQIEGPLGRWDALVQALPTATSVTRDRMMEQMRAIQNELAAIPAPACAQRTRDELLASMASMIEALWRTPTNEDPGTTAAFSSAQNQLAQARRAIAAR